MTWILVAVALIGLVLLARRASGGAAEGKRLVDEGALLLDVRTRQEFASGHLPGAKNIPVQDLEARRDELPPPSQPVVVYCRSGSRSARAKRLLRGFGFERVVDAGAMSAWPR